MFYPLHKKGGLSDFIFTNLFTLLVALLVLALFLAKASDIGSSTSFEKKFIGADLGLTIDSIYALRPDVNAVLRYKVPFGFGVKLKDRVVDVYVDNASDAKTFWFSGDPLVSFLPGEVLPESPRRYFRIAKFGNDLGVVSSLPNMVAPFCSNLGRFGGVIDYSEISGFGKDAAEVVTGEISVFAFSSNPNARSVVVYTNELSSSQELACLIVQNIVSEFPGIEGVAIIPSNPAMFPFGSPHHLISSDKTSVLVDLRLPVTSDARSRFGTALRGVIK